MSPTSDLTENHSDESIVKDATCMALYPDKEATADELFRNVSRNLSYPREQFDSLRAELARERRIVKSTSDPPTYTLP